MDSVISKISSYDIFTNLVPGAIFAYIMGRLEIYQFSTPSTLVDLVVFYFLGMVVSRVGSIIIEPVLCRMRFIKHCDYSQFIRASASDPKIDVLLESTNLYRSVLSVLLLSLVAYGIKLLTDYYGWSLRSVEIGTVIFLAGLFLLSYRKQSDYIYRRVTHHSKGV